MTTCLAKSVILAGLIVVSLAQGDVHGQGAVSIIQHTGSTDPTEEGFTLEPLFAHSSVGPITENGISAWNTTASNSNNTIFYTYSLTPQQQVATIDGNWILSFTLQALQSRGGMVGLLGGIVLNVGSGENGDPIVSSGLNQFVLTGGGSGYHDYQFLYNADSDSLALWIDGSERVDKFLEGFSFPDGVSGILWGEGQAAASGNWSLVSFQVVPEPSVIPLSLLGVGMMLFLRRRNRIQM